MTMTIVGLGWMLKKKITLGRKEGRLSWSCDTELWHFAFYLSLPHPSLFKENGPFFFTFTSCFFIQRNISLFKEKMVHSFLPYLTSCFFIQWRNGPLLCTFVHSSLTCVGHCDFLAYYHTWKAFLISSTHNINAPPWLTNLWQMTPS